MSRRNSVLYVSLNLGCSGICEQCPTRHMLGCNKITVEDMIDWNKLEELLRESKAETVCLIGGENPFKYSTGHRNIYYNLYNRVKAVGKKLIAIASCEGTTNTDILAFFDELYLYLPKNWKEDKLNVLNTLYIKTYVKIRTFIETDKVTEQWLREVRLEFFTNPTILLKTPEERRQIPEYCKRFGDFDFTGNIINKRYPIYSLTDNKYYRHATVKSIPWRELIRRLEK